ncbi:SAM-dependent methyltransferase [Microlunatus parietis]|uniref:Cyclopropane fatty-acyl-phospholipid synthase-like methyltransferase n=1 Tax=Microlunatus parietis TaxID=682979 RepID=A0A7Y9LA38_9ACTN|nr:methyltransferase domain-containing protein [Microlunatus parietis]NYE70232.1 cyclopropane fatty-acyl-phospholipid synthase-like methyltransferase [Microlunatus parietis]
MIIPSPELLLLPERFPRSSRYDPAWLLSLDMGPNPLWQLEELWDDLALQPGQRVLDLGPGRGATSVFLAREAGVAVDALDLWITVEEAAETYRAMGVEDLVTPRQGDIRTADLPEQGYDAIVSLDAWEYFGTDVYFLRRLVTALKPGGVLGFATPSLRDDPYLVEPLPLLAETAGFEVLTWHPAEWWAKHTALTGGLIDVKAWVPTDSLDLWQRWDEAVGGDSPMRKVVADYQALGGRPPALGLVHVVGRKPYAARKS